MFVIEEGGNVGMDTNSQPKKLLYQRSKSNQKPLSDYESLEQNRWNPFERADPALLERLHKKHENARKYLLLSQTEDAPI